MATPLRVKDKRNNYFYPKIKRPKRTKYSLGIIFIIILALFMSGIPTKIYNDIIVYRHGKITTYLNQREQFFSSSDLEFKQLLNKVYQSNSSDISSLTPDIQQVKTVLINHYSSVSELKPPRAFKDLHAETLHWYLKKNSAIDYLETAAMTNSYQPSTFKIYIDEINATVSNIQPKLIKGLQKERLEYKIHADGSVEYWFKTNGYIDNK